MIQSQHLGYSPQTLLWWMSSLHLALNINNMNWKNEWIVKNSFAWFVCESTFTRVKSRQVLLLLVIGHRLIKVEQGGQLQGNICHCHLSSQSGQRGWRAFRKCIFFWVSEAQELKYLMLFELRPNIPTQRRKNTANLYNDALLYTAVIIDWLDLLDCLDWLGQISHQLDN